MICKGKVVKFWAVCQAARVMAAYTPIRTCARRNTAASVPVSVSLSRVGILFILKRYILYPCKTQQHTTIQQH
jgi:hypothetical protein